MVVAPVGATWTQTKAVVSTGEPCRGAIASTSPKEEEPKSGLDTEVEVYPGSSTDNSPKNTPGTVEEWSPATCYTNGVDKFRGGPVVEGLLWENRL